MCRKRSPSIIPHFTGVKGRKKLLEAICSQQIVAGDPELAKRLSSAGSLQEYSAGKIIARQGGTDNDMYMIISGSVTISVNKREVAVRGRGSHVGEMALIDSTARRSATITTKEKTVVLKLSESKVAHIALKFPAYWRRIAVELAARLRERTKFIREPNPISNVFIGSSSEALKEAYYISSALKRNGLTCKLWTQGVFELSQTTIEDLIKASLDCDFAILFLTPDDMTNSRGRKKASPRDNVVFELGLFMGAIGRDRTLIIVPNDVDLKLPTDLLGVTRATYNRKRRLSVGKKLREVLKVLRRKISLLGPK